MHTEKLPSQNWFGSEQSHLLCWANAAQWLFPFGFWSQKRHNSPEKEKSKWKREMNNSVMKKTLWWKICCWNCWEEPLWIPAQEVKSLISYCRRTRRKGCAQPLKESKWRRGYLGTRDLLPLVAGSWRGSGVAELGSHQHSWELWRRNVRDLKHSGRVLSTISLPSLNFAGCGRSEWSLCGMSTHDVVRKKWHTLYVLKKKHFWLQN